MNHGSLFTGIGGFDLAAQWCDWQNIFQVEINDFCQKVLAKNFPGVKQYKDIKEFDGKKYKGTIDIISGGFPCQPFSVAGKRKGTEDDRSLWHEMFRIIKEIKPDWIVGENVPGIINMELDNMLSDLETEGYETQAFIIPACAVNAPHRRDRVWIVANNDSNRCSIRSTLEQKRFNTLDKKRSTSKNNKRWKKWQCELRSINSIVPNSDTKRLEREKPKSEFSRGQQRCIAECGWWSIEPDVDRVANGIPHRVDRLRMLGNAIVPQIAYEIFKCIDQIEQPNI